MYGIGGFGGYTGWFGGAGTYHVAGGGELLVKGIAGAGAEIGLLGNVGAALTVLSLTAWRTSPTGKMRPRRISQAVFTICERRRKLQRDQLRYRRRLPGKIAAPAFASSFAITSAAISGFGPLYSIRAGIALK